MGFTNETIARHTEYHYDYDLYHIKYDDGTEEFRLRYYNWDTCSPEDCGVIENYAKTKEEALARFEKAFKLK